MTAGGANDEILQRTFEILAMAGDQQAALQKVLEGLAAERAALAKERQNVGQAAARLAPSVCAAVDASVKGVLAGAAETAATALNEASKPIAERLSAAVVAVDGAEAKLSRAVAAFRWKWILAAGALTAGGVLMAILVGWTMAWWERHQVESLVEQRQALVAEIERLQANVAALEQRGGKIEIKTCGKRLCIAASTDQGTNEAGRPASLGGWTLSDGTQLVIPKGY